MQGRYYLYKWLKNTQNLLLPEFCCLCGKGPVHESHGLCVGCLADLPYNHNACSACALPLQHGEEALCGQCLQKEPPMERTRAPFLYGLPMDRLIIDLKFNRKLRHARILSRLMCDELSAITHADMPDVLLPVPLHPARLRERGYNQAVELARPLSRSLGVPLMLHAVERRRATRAQAQLDKKERRKNLRGAFHVRADVSDRHIAIVDDVVTTATTVSELGRSLLKAGAARVEVWACCRALGPEQI